VARDKQLDQLRDVIAALGQGGQPQHPAGQLLGQLRIEVGGQAAARGGKSRRRDETHVVLCARCGRARVVLGKQDLQELALDPLGQVLDSREKKRSAGRQRELASTRSVRARPILEDCLQVAGQHLRALDGHERPLAARGGIVDRARHRLVAAARLSQQQQGKRRASLVGDRGAESGDRIRATEQRLLHAPERVLAQFVGQGQRTLQLAVAHFESALQTAQREMGVHPGHDFSGIVGLGDEVNRPCIQSPHLCGGVIQCGTEDERHLFQGRVSLHLPAHLQSIHLGHHHVEKDERRRALPGEVQTLASTVGQEQRVPEGAQRFSQDLQVQRDIVHQQDARGLAGIDGHGVCLPGAA
jgi:hypothetical protein